MINAYDHMLRRPRALCFRTTHSHAFNCASEELVMFWGSSDTRIVIGETGSHAVPLYRAVRLIAENLVQLITASDLLHSV